MDYARKAILELLNKYTQEDLAAMLDEKQPNISAFKNGTRPVSKKVRVNLHEKFNYDYNKLFIQKIDVRNRAIGFNPDEINETTVAHGLYRQSELDYLNSTINNEKKNSKKTNQLPKQESNGRIRDEAKIPLKVTIIPAKAQLGLQSFVYADELMEELDTKTIYREKEYKGTYYEIECTGDSMYDGSEESIKDGDFILCRSISRMHWQNKLHINDWIFVIFHRELGIIVKQIIAHNTETKELTLHSFNTDKNEYPDFTININQCEKICNIVEVRKVKKGKYGY